jgi:hypothetical protein
MMKIYNAIQRLVVKAVLYLGTKVLPFALGLGVLGALSFIFTGGFTFTLLSERVFYESLIVFLIGGTVAMSHMVTGRVIMFPFNIRKPEDAKRFVEEQPKHRAANEKRLDVGIQLWLIGLGTLGISALIQTLLA